jgi:hypothetical protein
METENKMSQPKPRNLTPLEKAGLPRIFRNEFKRLVKVGENQPFAYMMADRAQLIEYNRLRFSPPAGD